jgi:hypothetical protein
MHGIAAPLTPLAIGVTCASIAALMIERPMAQWGTPLYDTISIAHCAALALALAVIAGMRFCTATPMWRRGAYVVITAVLPLALLYAMYPLLFAGPMAGVDPFIISDFLPNISEAKPFYRSSPFDSIAMLILPFAAIQLCMAGLGQANRKFYADAIAHRYSFFLLVTLLMWLTQARWIYYLLPLSIIVVAPALGALFNPTHASLAHTWPGRWLSGLSERQRVVRRIPILIAIVGLPLLILMAGQQPWRNDAALTQATVISEEQAERLLKKTRQACYRTTRQLLYSGEINRVLGSTPQTILAPTDLGAEILFWTNHRIIASNYHREGAGIAYVWGVDAVTQPQKLRELLAQRGVDVVLYCPGNSPKKDSVLQQLMAAERLPTWLKKLNFSTPKVSDDSPFAAGEIKADPLILRVR